MKKIILYSLTALAALQSVGQGILHLDDAINIALKNSLDIHIAKNRLESNTILNNYGVAGGLPLVTASINDNEQVTNVNQKLNTGVDIQRNGATANNLNAGVTGSILLFNGFRVISTKKRLEELEKQSQQQLNSQVQNIIGAVQTAYYDIIRQQSYIQTINSSIDISRKKLEIVQTRQSVGLANNADLFQSQLDLNASLQAYAGQQLVIDLAKTALLRLLDLRTDSLVYIQDTILVDRSLSLASVLNNLDKNPDILAAQEQVRINQQIVKETASQRYPSVRGNAGYNFINNKTAAGQLLLNQSYGPFVGLNVTIPIYNGSAYRRQQKVAEINVNTAEMQKDILLRDYRSDIVKTYESYANSLKQLETEQQNYKIAAQLVDLVLQRFQLRQATIIDLKNAQQSFEESGYRLVNLNYAAKFAEIELKRVSNQLTL